MSNLRPLHDFVIILPNEAPEKSPGGIIISHAKEKPSEGKVIAVGPGRILENGTRVRPEVEVGVSVLFPQYGGTEIELDGVKHRVVRESDILAVLGPV